MSSGVTAEELFGIGHACKIAMLCKRKLRQEFKAVFAAIDSVHRVKRLNPIEVYVTKNKAADGQYHRDKYTKAPTGIEISRLGATPGLTLVHEIGHFLEGAAIPKADARERQWGVDPLVAAWKQAVAESVPARRLEKMSKTGIISENRPAAPIFVSYLREEREFWARSYAQYIATKSGDERLLEQLAIVRSPRFPYPLQWADDDFGPIAETIDILFAEIGWRP